MRLATTAFPRTAAAHYFHQIKLGIPESFSPGRHGFLCLASAYSHIAVAISDYSKCREVWLVSLCSLLLRLLNQTALAAAKLASRLPYQDKIAEQIRF